eukprot:1341762-Rhodomonas_salina.4
MAGRLFQHWRLLPGELLAMLAASNTPISGSEVTVLPHSQQRTPRSGPLSARSSSIAPGWVASVLAVRHVMMMIGFRVMTWLTLN